LGPAVALMARYTASAEGEAKTSPQTAAVSIPRPTYPHWPGSCPDPPPETRETLSNPSLGETSDLKTTRIAGKGLSSRSLVLESRTRPISALDTASSSLKCGFGACFIIMSYPNLSSQSSSASLRIRQPAVSRFFTFPPKILLWPHLGPVFPRQGSRGLLAAWLRVKCSPISSNLLAKSVSRMRKSEEKPAQTCRNLSCRKSK